MALATFVALQDHVLQMAGMSGTPRRTLAKEWINKAHQEVCEAHDWHELTDVKTVNTVANYNTGTVALTLGAKTITGTGTTFPAGSADRKFSAGFGQPFFNIASYTSGTEIALTDDWPFTSLSGDSFEIYEDVYSLDSTVDKVFLDRVTLHDSQGGVLGHLNHAGHLSEYPVPQCAGRPEWFSIIENDSSGNKQIMLGPRAPDDVYVVRYHFKKKHVTLSGDSDVPLLPETLLEVVAQGALSRAFQMPEFIGTGVDIAARQLFDKMLAEKIRRYRRQSPSIVRPMAFGDAGRRGYPFSLPVDAT